MVELLIVAYSGIRGVYSLSEGRKEENHPVYFLSLEQDYDKPGSYEEDRMAPVTEALRMLELEDS